MGSTAEISPGWCDHRSSRDSVVGLARELLQGYRAQGTPDRTRSRFVQPKGWPTTLLDWAPVQDTQGDHQGANGLPRMLTHMDYDHMPASGESLRRPRDKACLVWLWTSERGQGTTISICKYVCVCAACRLYDKDRIKTCVKRWQRRVCKAMRREDREHVHRLILSRAPGPPACSCQSTTSRGKWLAAGQILLSDKRPRKGNARSRSDPPSQFPASNHLAITISTKFSVERGVPCGATDKSMFGCDHVCEMYGFWPCSATRLKADWLVELVEYMRAVGQFVDTVLVTQLASQPISQAISAWAGDHKV
ncbi:hypothetical protein J3E71DRAFT_242335 [Bipolaris maydis]|nr:hypothetical protein J3E71DRAFT_242335 [Bipolaris maydis]